MKFLLHSHVLMSHRFDDDITRKETKVSGDPLFLKSAISLRGTGKLTITLTNPYCPTIMCLTLNDSGV